MNKMISIIEKDETISKIEYKYKSMCAMAICALVYKVILDCGFWSILKSIYYFEETYEFDFNITKYIIGYIWLFLLFIMIRHYDNRPSTFFLQLQYFLAIVPMSTIYAFSDEKSLYFFAICISFSLAEIVVFLSVEIDSRYKRAFNIFDKAFFTKVLICAMYLSTIIVYIDMILENGMFSMKALNIYNVYDVRAEFELNKYVGYLFNWQYIVFNPFFIIRFLKKDDKLKAAFFILLQLIAYMYAAQKTILFIIPLLLILYYFSKIRYFQLITYWGFTGLVAFSIFMYNNIGIASTMFSLFVRRVLFVPANLKFVYYDFFSNNPHIGFAGTLIGKFLNIEFPYDGSIGKMISAVYFNSPDMNSNTGFLAEGYYRFGLFGIVIALIVFGLLLVAIDRFSKKNGYDFTIAICFFSMFLLNDGELIDPLIFGNLTVLVAIFILYNNKYDRVIHIKDLFKRGKK